MDAITARPSLLSAARNFIRKSAGTAVVVIAPLAAISVANSAKAQSVVFSQAQTSGFSLVGTSGSTAFPYFLSSGFFTTSGGNSVHFGSNVGVFNSGSAFSDGYLYIYLNSINGFSSGSLPVGSSIPFDYGFSLTSTGDITVKDWSLSVDLTDQSEPNFHLNIGDTSVGDISGTTFLTINPTDNPNGLPNFANYDVIMAVHFASASPGDSLSVIMDRNLGQGFTLTAIPEPSTYAALLGLGALGLVVRLRRSRRAAA